jgi:transketolase
VSSTLTAGFQLLNRDGRADLAAHEPERFQYQAEGGSYLNIQGLSLDHLADIDEPKIANLCRLARGLAFAAVDAAESGHPGGSSSKAEMAMTLLVSGALKFDAWNPKHSGRSRLVWSAGHCSPLFHALVSLVYETLRQTGFNLDSARARCAVYPEQLAHFRRWGGPAGHVESEYALADTSTGSSGHGLSAALGFALLHRSCGLPTRAFVLAGDAETEEGMSYEARNLAANLGMDNLIVALDYNHFGIDGPISEVLPVPYLNHWFAHGWNVIEVNGHNIRELAYAYRLAADGFGAGRPTVIVCHTTKGMAYGKLEGTADSHGSPLPHDEYVAAVRKLGFDIPGKKGETGADIQAMIGALSAGDAEYLHGRLQAIALEMPAEPELIETMKTALAGRPLNDHTTLRRPDVLPPELVFQEGDLVATRKATEAWFTWAMKNSSFFYLGAGDLMKSILTGKGESVYGVVSRGNPLGRGIRFGIAEQNMAMLSCGIAQDVLPGGYRPMSAFATYGVFTPMMANGVRMTLINNAVNQGARSFFIMLAAHDGPETGQDGPTHHGLFWMSLFSAYPGIKVYKPLDANEAVEMLFHAMERDEPVVFSAVRPGTPVLTRGNGVPPAREAIQGAYVFRPFGGTGRRKLVLVVSGGQVMANLLEILPAIEGRADVKIVAVTSPQLFEELRRTDPQKADEILSAEDRRYVMTLHNGWRGFLYPFLLPADHAGRTFGMDDFSRSGIPSEIYHDAGFDPSGLLDRILGAL